MDQREIEHRNQVLHAYFEGRDWDKNNEYTLKRKLVLDGKQLLPNYPYVIEDEWEVEPGRTDRGRGDLVFTDGNGRFAIVEVKWIDLQSTGRTGSTRRGSNRKKRRTVEEQAASYAEIYAKLIFDELDTVKQVEAFVFTNEYEQPRRL
ncbi:MAG: hypothetical protein HC881_15580 [Leptolyngbyaceae cyanobacterium SL_7_1]|nr:hypothetical protein [Leptolyngbyaceae cyanobacterium SL_7_1]